MTENQRPTAHNPRLATIPRDVLASHESLVLSHSFSVIGFSKPGVVYGDAPSRGIGVQLLSGLN